MTSKRGRDNGSCRGPFRLFVVVVGTGLVAAEARLSSPAGPRGQVVHL